MLLEWLATLSEDLGIPKTLKEIGVEDISRMHEVTTTSLTLKKNGRSTLEINYVVSYKIGTFQVAKKAEENPTGWDNVIKYNAREYEEIFKAAVMGTSINHDVIQGAG